MSLLAQAQRSAATAGHYVGEWRNIGEEVWSGRNRLFSAQDAKMAEHIAALHNLAIPLSNLLTRALKELKDLRRLMQIRRGM